jgi:hypothetical protein
MLGQVSALHSSRHLSRQEILRCFVKNLLDRPMKPFPSSSLGTRYFSQAQKKHTSPDFAIQESAGPRIFFNIGISDSRCKAPWRSGCKQWRTKIEEFTAGICIAERIASRMSGD